MNNDLLEQAFKEMTDKVRQAASEGIINIECDLLPYPSHDTAMTASLQAEEIVRHIASGNFKRDGDYIVVQNARDHSPRVRMKLTTQMYDTLRDNLVKSMPACPKDLKIQALQNQIKSLYESFSR